MKNELLYELFQQLDGDYPVRGLRFLSRVRRFEEIEKLIHINVEEGRLDIARKAADLLPEPRRTEEVRKLFSIHPEETRLDDARKIVQQLNRKFTPEELETLFETYLEKEYAYIRGAIEVAKLFPEPRRTEALGEVLGICVKRKWFDIARKIADLILDS